MINIEQYLPKLCSYEKGSSLFSDSQCMAPLAASSTAKSTKNMLNKTFTVIFNNST